MIRCRRDGVSTVPGRVLRIRRHYHNSPSSLRHPRRNRILIHPHTAVGNIPNTCSGIRRCLCPPVSRNEKQKLFLCPKKTQKHNRSAAPRKLYYFFVFFPPTLYSRLALFSLIVISHVYYTRHAFVHTDTSYVRSTSACVTLPVHCNMSQVGIVVFFSSFFFGDFYLTSLIQYDRLYGRRYVSV